MDPEKIKKNQEYAEEAFWTGHYHYMMQALAVAMSHTMVWRLVGDGTPFTLKDIFEFAREYDEKHEIEAPSFYYVSREGAIALCPGLEYLAEWLFVPMEPCQERDFLLRDLQERLQEEAAAEEAVEKAITEGLAKEKLSAKYYIMKDGKQAGPYTPRQLVLQKISVETLVWANGMPSWTKAGQVPEIAQVLNPAPAPAASSQPAARYYMLGPGNQKIGPLPIDQLVRNGLNTATLVWTEGMPQWKKAADVPAVAAALRAPAPAPQPPMPQPDPAPIPAPQPTVKYRMYVNNQQYGPFTVDELVRNGVTPTTLVWTEGMPGWTKAADVPQIAAKIRH